MPKPLAHYTELAQRDVAPTVVAAVPARHPSFAERIYGPSPIARLRAPLVSVANRLAGLTIGKAALAHRSAHDQANVFTIVVAIHPDAATMHRLERFGRRLGPEIGRASLTGLRYERYGLAIQTMLTIDGASWLVHGWFERELRSALQSLDHLEEA